MLYAEWSGTKVKLYSETKMLLRQFNVPHNVVGVQVSGNNLDDGMVSIAMENGRTRIYKANGTLVRQ